MAAFTKQTERLHGSGSPPEVMIFGGGPCAQKIAANLSEHNVHAWIATSEDAKRQPSSGNKISWLAGSRLIDCKGFAREFKLSLAQGHASVYKKVAAIVVAQDQMHSPNYEFYGLSPNKRILDISSLEKKIGMEPTDELFQDGACIALLCGWDVDSHPAVAQRMLNCCLQLQQNTKISTVFLTGNLKVSSDGAEGVYQQAKRIGTQFFKFTQTFPTIRVIADGGFDITLHDELTHAPYQINAQWLVVDETMGPARELMGLGRTLKIGSDDQGFAQSDNVHRLSNYTNRRGIFVAGGARGMLSHAEQLEDADQVTWKVLTYLKDADKEPLPRLEVHRGKCARCLTCHRLCPHQAIDIGKRISIVAQACQSCGICLAGCPARAIDMDGLHISSDLKTGYPDGRNTEQRRHAPDVVVFGCSRSAGKAHQLVRVMGRAMPEGVRFVEVPCGGTISSRHLLAAFDAGSDGVMLCTCHGDNCKSETGNKLARRRTDSARDILISAGVERERLNFISLAANMGNEYYMMVNEFVERIGALNG